MRKGRKVVKDRREWWESLSWNKKLMVIVFIFVIWFGWLQFQT